MPSNGGEFHFSPLSMESKPTFSLIIFFTLSLSFLSILIYSVFKSLRKTDHKAHNPVTHKPDPAHSDHSLLLNLVSSESPKWPHLFEPDLVPSGSVLGTGRVDSDCEKKKKKRKRGKKEKEKKNKEGEEEKEGQKEEEVVCVYPFTTTSSVTQRRFKQQYDELIKSHGSKGLTLTQVGQFVNCLVEARSDLKHKSEIIQRKFTITKALLLKADRSSLDRLSQKINKLELEHKRVEEDVLVYNWLQQQLKLSPAYKQMVEIGTCMELKARSMELAERVEDEFSDISFEELLEQEKKDSFWQKKGKPRSCVS